MPPNIEEEDTVGLIVVGIDDSAGAREVLHFALDEARLRQATLRAVHAIRAFGSYPSLEWGGSDVRNLHRAAEDIIEDATSEVAAEGEDVQVERRVIEGAPMAVLVEESRDADLVVVGSRSHADFPGSVSQQCAHHAECPVVIVRAPSEKSD
jgi:nucleotide-binding universal stress UspA family protein